MTLFLWTICLKPQNFLFEPAIENGKERKRKRRDCEMNWFDRYTGGEWYGAGKGRESKIEPSCFKRFKRKRRIQGWRGYLSLRRTVVFEGGMNNDNNGAFFKQL